MVACIQVPAGQMESANWSVAVGLVLFTDRLNCLYTVFMHYVSPVLFQPVQNAFYDFATPYLLERDKPGCIVIVDLRRLLFANCYGKS